jgi:hypothetical protein
MDMPSKTVIKYQRNKANGMCVRCGKLEPIPGKVLCEKCHAKNVVKNTRNYEARKNKGVCTDCKSPNLITDSIKCPDCNEKARDRNKKIKLDVLKAYGNQCVCCGEKQYEFLSLDHINNDGAAHRIQTKRTNIYRWAKASNYPDTIQLMCFNCNLSKGFFGICPHQLRVENPDQLSLFDWRPLEP